MIKIGKYYEKVAFEYFQEKRFQIIGTNIYSKFGEIDILAFKNNCHYMIEVKFRKNIDNAAYSIFSKQTKKSLLTFYIFAELNQILFEQIYLICFLTDGVNYKIYNINFDILL